MVMVLRIAPLPRFLATHHLYDHAVLIDVQRATSTLVTAFARGLAEARIFRDVEEAAKREQDLLGGERDFVRIEGFDLDNSPRAYTESVVRGRQLSFTSTNGASALGEIVPGVRVALGSFLNLRAASDFAASHEDVLLLCSGTHGERSDEDELCAGTIALVVEEERGGQGFDSTTREIVETARLAQANGNFWWRLMNESKNAVGLRKAGLAEDIRFVSQTDLYGDVLPVRERGEDAFRLIRG